jgi:DNA-binding NarL/FixJ family response regulator
MSTDDATRRVLIGEDQRGMRGLVHQLLDDQDGIEVVAEAATGQEVLERFVSTQPDVVVLDLGMPVIDGEMVLRTLRATRPETRIVVLSGQASAIIRPRLLDEGADAVVEKGLEHWEAALVAEVRRKG